MKKKYLVPILLVVLAHLPSLAQGNSEQFVADMLFLSDRFAQPASEGAAYQGSAGWAHSAKVLASWQFRLSLQGNALFIPKEKKLFHLSNKELQVLSLEGDPTAELPTAFGGRTSRVFTGEISFRNPSTGQQETRTLRFSAFDGIDREIIPHAFVQFSIGLPYGTEIVLRGMPEVTLEDVSAKTYGIGIKHSISQYFGQQTGVQLALALAYSRFHVGYKYEPIQVEDYILMNAVEVAADLWMLEGIASRRWGMFEFVGALGAASSSFDYTMGGSGPALVTVNSELEQLGAVQGYIKGDLGVNVYMNKFRLSAMATVGKFFNANMGLHLGF